MRNITKCGLIVLPFSLALFFGLLFGLNYPEIVRHGWPLTRCYILDSKIDTRYCCEEQCNNGCTNAPSSAPTCSSQISFVDNGFTPSQCAANSTDCPTSAGQPCDGGYYCCDTCCNTCTSCTSSCTGTPPSCSTSCTDYTCNCYCCSSVNHLNCVLECPICFFVDLSLTFYSGKMRNYPHNTTYHEDFGKNQASAQSFYQSHLANSTSTCHYNPKSLTEVSFDVSFTPWKWAITAIFGILPLFINISVFVALFCVIPTQKYLSRLVTVRSVAKLSALSFTVGSPFEREGLVTSLVSQDADSDVKTRHNLKANKCGVDG